MARQEDLPDEFEEMVRIGTIASADPASGRVSVSVGDIETDDIRWVERRSGATRTFSPPSVGEQVLLLCPSGEIAGALALGGITQDDFPLPGNSAREVIIYQDGAELAYDPEAHKLDALLPDGGTVEIRATGGVTVTCTEGGLTITASSGGVTIDASGGGVSITGDVSIEGNVAVEGTVTATDDVKAGSISLNSHKHAGVSAGGAKTQGPE